MYKIGPKKYLTKFCKFYAVCHLILDIYHTNKFESLCFYFVFCKTGNINYFTVNWIEQLKNIRFLTCILMFKG